MADMNTIPFDIQAEILKWVPDVKSLLKFRPVSKSWKSYIDSPQFIAGYHQSQPPRHHVFLWYDYQFRDNYVSIIDDDDDSCFAQHKFPLDIPNSVESLVDFAILGTSKGLFCFYNYNIYRGTVVLWNPTIRKSVTIDVPKVSYKFTIGFGVSPYSSDPKLLRIQNVFNASDDLKPRIVEIYSLSTGEWRTLSSEDVPRSSVVFKHGYSEFCDDKQVAIGNFIFWHAEDRNMKREMIMLFDMISEKFSEIYLPDNVVTKDQNGELSLFKLRESLAVVESYVDLSVEKKFLHVWMMEGGVSDSFTKMYSIIRPDEDVYSLLAFRNNGHPIIGTYDDTFECPIKPCVYEPDSKQFTPIGPFGSESTNYVGSYMETLLLLDH